MPFPIIFLDEGGLSTARLTLVPFDYPPQLKLPVGPVYYLLVRRGTPAPVVNLAQWLSRRSPI
jgi:hypothetical protein